MLILCSLSVPSLQASASRKAKWLWGFFHEKYSLKLCAKSGVQKHDQVRSDNKAAVQVGGGSSFCYLGDMLSAVGGCELAVTTCVKTA